jgi:nucleolar protein 15
LDNGSDDGHESQKPARPSPAKRAKKAETSKPAHAKKAKAGLNAQRRVSPATDDDDDQPPPTTIARRGKAVKAAEKSPDLEGGNHTSTDRENDSAESEDGHDAMAALLKGFDSSDDDDVPEDVGFTPGQIVPRIPEPRQAADKPQLVVKGSKEKKGSGQKDRGVIYVGLVFSSHPELYFPSKETGLNPC